MYNVQFLPLSALSGSSQEACDSLAYKTLMNIDTLKSYMDMLRETHWLVVMGTKGTCKTSLATGLARHLSMCLMKEEDVEEDDDELMVTIGGEVMTFNVDKDSLEVRQRQRERVKEEERERERETFKQICSQTIIISGD